jgi:hypothetical protein
MTDPRDPDEAERRREIAGGFKCEFCGEESDSPICYRCAKLIKEEKGYPDT